MDDFRKASLSVPRAPVVIAPLPAPVVPAPVPAVPISRQDPVDAYFSDQGIEDITKAALSQSMNEELQNLTPNTEVYNSVLRRYGVYSNIISSVLRGTKLLAEKGGIDFNQAIAPFAEALAKALQDLRKQDTGPWNEILGVGVKDAKTIHDLMEAITKGIEKHIDVNIVKVLSQIPIELNPMQMNTAKQKLSGRIFNLISIILDNEVFTNMFKRDAKDPNSLGFYNQLATSMYLPLYRSVINALTGFNYNNANFVQMLNDPKQQQKVHDAMVDTMKNILGKAGLAKETGTTRIYDLDVVKNALGDAILNLVKESEPNIEDQKLAEALVGLFTKKITKKEMAERLRKAMDAKLLAIFNGIKKNYEAVKRKEKGVKPLTALVPSTIDFTPLEGTVTSQMTDAVKGSATIKAALTKGLTDGLKGMMSSIAQTQSDAKEYTRIIQEYFKKMLYDTKEVEVEVENDDGEVQKLTQTIQTFKPAVTDALMAELKKIGHDLVFSADLTKFEWTDDDEKKKNELINHVLEMYFPKSVKKENALKQRIEEWANEIVEQKAAEVLMDQKDPKKPNKVHEAISNIMTQTMEKIFNTLGTDMQSISTSAAEATSTETKEKLVRIFGKEAADATIATLNRYIALQQTDWTGKLTPVLKLITDTTNNFNQFVRTVDKYFTTFEAYKKSIPNESLIKNYTDKLESLLNTLGSLDSEMLDAPRKPVKSIASLDEAQLSTALAPIKTKLDTLEDVLKVVFPEQFRKEKRETESIFMKLNKIINNFNTGVKQQVDELKSSVEEMKGKLEGLEAKFSDTGSITTTLERVENQVNSNGTELNTLITGLSPVMKHLFVATDPLSIHNLNRGISDISGYIVQQIPNILSWLTRLQTSISSINLTPTIDTSFFTQEVSNIGDVIKLLQEGYQRMQELMTVLEMNVRQNTDDLTRTKVLAENIAYYYPYPRDSEGNLKSPRTLRIPVFSNDISDRNFWEVINTVHSYLPNKRYVNGEFLVINRVDDRKRDIIDAEGRYQGSYAFDLAEMEKVILGMDPKKSTDDERRLISVAMHEKELRESAPYISMPDNTDEGVRTLISRILKRAQIELGANNPEFATWFPNYWRMYEKPITFAIKQIFNDGMTKEEAIRYVTYVLMQAIPAEMPRDRIKAFTSIDWRTGKPRPWVDNQGNLQEKILARDLLNGEDVLLNFIVDKLYEKPVPLFKHFRE